MGFCFPKSRRYFLLGDQFSYTVNGRNHKCPFHLLFSLQKSNKNSKHCVHRNKISFQVNLTVLGLLDSSKISVLGWVYNLKPNIRGSALHPPQSVTHEEKWFVIHWTPPPPPSGNSLFLSFSFQFEIKTALMLTKNIKRLKALLIRKLKFQRLKWAFLPEKTRRTLTTQGTRWRRDGKIVLRFV